ncbi:MAG: sigma 54-interacting transcriptional regulator [Planctomycetes bacterium]|nr:sigma 54-interacting transcriptional regulator [Planctomycetota bacterium]
MPSKSTVVLGLLGSTLDAGTGQNRWNRWRPTVSLCQHEELLVRRLELLYDPKFGELAQTLVKDIQAVSPETNVRLRTIKLKDPWDFEEVYGALHDFARSYPFDTDKENYLIHITTGTHVAQICLFLLTESRYLPGKLIQTSPSKAADKGVAGTYSIIDLDLSKYDRLASRFRMEQREGLSFLKGGIDTRNSRFNALIERIERVAIASRDPILLMGPTGAGKSLLARRIYELKKSRRQLTGEFVEVNSAILRGDSAMSALFGHVKGAFTGAVSARPGLLRKAHQGLLLLDEIGELELEEQAMLLRALEEKCFLPVGADEEIHSDFQLIAGTNRDLPDLVQEGRFREDLLARINLWTFRLPGLRERGEDIEPNFDYELDRFAQRTGAHVTCSREARQRFLAFATSREAAWAGNFRDLNGAVARMATLAPGGRISVREVEEELERLRTSWERPSAEEDELLVSIVGAERVSELDPFDRVQLAEVLRICRRSRSLSEAGRTLFSASRTRKKSANDADRLCKYLARFGLLWKDVATAADYAP